jgi:DNA-binding Xre family transcriptional regulator
MLKLNLKPILAARGISKPLSFLVEAGLSYRTAHILLKYGVSAIKLSHLEKLCSALHCTPNDLMEWTDKTIGGNTIPHPLQELNKGKINVDLYKKLQTLPLSKLNELSNILQNGESVDGEH